MVSLRAAGTSHIVKQASSWIGQRYKVSYQFSRNCLIRSSTWVLCVVPSQLRTCEHQLDLDSKCPPA